MKVPAFSITRSFQLSTVLVAFVTFVSGCGVNRFSASTTASYKTPDGTVVEYTSNKEHEGVIVEIKEVEGKTKAITIRVESAGTSEAALAAMSRAYEKIAGFLENLAPLITKAAMAGS